MTDSRRNERPGGEEIQRRTLSSLAFQGGGTALQFVVLGVRSVVLARLLPVVTFGVYAGTRVVLVLVAAVFALGLSPALIADHELTRDEDRAASVHLFLRTVISAAWASASLVIALTVLDGQVRTAALVLTATMVVDALLTTPTAILTRRVVHRRLALTALLADVVSSVVAIGLALAGADLWALLSVHVASSVVGVVLLYVHRPVWRPRLRWDGAIGRHLLGFGMRAGIADLLSTGLDRLDDLYVATVLGATPMGFYNRAFTFARYPRRIAGAPVNAVSLGSLSAATTRQQRTQVFELLVGVLARAGFLLAGVLAVAAPELILVLLGERWLPLLDAFRLMLLYALLDPLKALLGHVLIAGGEPQRLVWVRLGQLALLAVGLVTLGSSGIAGVALAVDVMALAGTAALLWQGRRHVEVSLGRLFAKPLLALLVAFAAGLSVRAVGEGTWPVLLGSVAAFTGAFAGVLLLVDRSATRRVLEHVRTRRGRLRS